MPNQQRATYNGMTVLVTRGYADKTVDLTAEDGTLVGHRVNPADVVLEPWPEEPPPAPVVAEVKAPAARASAKAKKPTTPTTKKPTTRKRSR